MPNHYYECKKCGNIDVRTEKLGMVKLSKEKCAKLSGEPPKACGFAPLLPVDVRDGVATIAVDPPATANATAALSKDEVLKIFETRGLWVRSIMHTGFLYCLNAPPIDPVTLNIAKATGKWQGGEEIFMDAWSLVHPEIKMVLFQMGKETGTRNVALLVDWALTADRFLDFSGKDKSSNKKVSGKDVLHTPGECKQELTAQIAVAQKKGGGGVGDHNEVNTIQINEDALVALIFCATKDCAAWNPHGKALMTEFVKKTKDSKPRAPKRANYPVFTYDDGKLVFVDNV